ncbi:ATP-grasp domain-containing protein [Saccharopolyspora kobensis]|uniref:ATP-grasp domain-containing protein n=1 Tax=Saccharopolyspora kobensis TaxID=146035 RepID=A0A1H5TA76_9PSEU|nr:ATP-grasp domain-containing protein [Saccharopolyspora kobensis]SEF59048.1 ATP-grasp domain-containing protein [Saccharopolyspora kobensis]SFC48984.1 ATP-grasp domain-containing protein [Saccharopolyspora kobensis]
MTNVFVVGLDPGNLALLRGSFPRNYSFHPLFGKSEIMPAAADFPVLLEEAHRRLDEFGGPIDAIVSYWDFPGTSLVPALCPDYGVPGPRLEPVIKCEHKYWSRIEQRKAADAHPKFGLVDLAGEPGLPPGLSFPVWLKPVKSYSSVLAFHVAEPAELARAMAEIRQGIDVVGKSFDAVLSGLEVPPEIAVAGGRACLAEEEIRGVQATAEGYCYHGEPHVYGVIDSLHYPGTSSFLRYQYPSRLPAPVQRRIADVSTRVIRQIGLDSTAFNIEFFWGRDDDELNVLEINPRISQSHAQLFKLVDGLPNHHCMVRLALGEEPEMPRRRGTHAVAAKWFLRAFADGVVRSCPTEQDIARVRREMPEATVDVVAREGMRLSELAVQDSYSYELATCCLGARDEAELIDKFHRCTELLPFTFDDREGAPAPLI